MRATVVAVGLMLGVGCAPARAAQPSPALLVVVDRDSLPDADCGRVAAAVGEMAAALPGPNLEVQVVAAGATFTPSATADAVRSTLCSSGASIRSPSGITAAEAFEIVRRNEAVRDAVIQRVCGVGEGAGCGSRVGAEAQALVNDLRDRSAAFVETLTGTLRRGGFDAFAVVTAGPPTSGLGGQGRSRLRAAAKGLRERIAIVAVEPGAPSTLSALQKRTLKELEEALGATVAPLDQAGEATRRLARLTTVPTSEAPVHHAGDGDRSETRTLVRLASAHVAEFAREASVVLAIEEYDQQVKSRAGSFGLSASTRMGIIRQRRTLKSEVALVQVLDGSVWMLARDVMEVDGQPVPDRTSLRSSIPTGSIEDALQYLRRVADAGARYNLGDIRRNLNTPTLALVVLLDAFRERFDFRTRRREGDTVVLAFEEKSAPTLFQVNDTPVQATGTFQVDPLTGAIRGSELVLAAPRSAVRGTVRVAFAHVPEVGAWMPVKMTELYEVVGRENDWIECAAEYSQFRRFRVTSRIR